MILFGNSIQAQYTHLNGIALQANSVLYLENNEPKSDAIDQLYNFSFIDEILVHSIYSKGLIKESQVYKLSNIKKEMDKEITVLKADGESGLSGRVYKYEIRISKDGYLVEMYRWQPEGTKETFKGDVIPLKTFKQ